MNLTDILTQQLSGDALSRISEKIGIDKATAGTAISAAIPLLVSALARKSSTPEGAEAIHQSVTTEHNGGILDDVMGFLSGGSSGGANILTQLLGTQRGAIENGLAQHTGLNTGAIGNILEMAAPLVMGALSKKQTEQGLDAGGLSSYLGNQQQAAQSSASPLMNTLFNMLDANNDGSIIDDIGRIAGKLFGGQK